jgi:hypothetical protein
LASFLVDDVESLAAEYSSQQARRQLIRKALAYPDQVFHEIDLVYQDQSYAGLVEEIELVYPARRILQLFTTPVYDGKAGTLVVCGFTTILQSVK